MKKDFTVDFWIYNEEILKQAISDFSEVGEIELRKNVITISGEIDSEIEEIFNELMNYILSL